MKLLITNNADGNIQIEYNIHGQDYSFEITETTIEYVIVEVTSHLKAMYEHK